jgi:oxygen-independent coproporphyrinogen-3 oxidase
MEDLSAEDRLVELVLLRLRTSDGLPLAEFREGAGVELDAWTGGRSAQLESQGFLEEREGVLRLTEEGLCVADTVISLLVASRRPAS